MKSLNQVAFFRELNSLALGLKDQSAPSRASNTDAMFRLIAQGKLAAEQMPPDEKKTFLTKMLRMTNVSTATLGLDAEVTTKKKDKSEEGEYGLPPPHKYVGSEITDRREIEFNLAAIVSIVAASSTNRPMQVVIREDLNLIYVEYIYKTVTLTTTEIGAMLISYCIQNKMPISRHVDKSLVLKPSSVTLKFKTVHNQAAQGKKVASIGKV